MKQFLVEVFTPRSSAGELAIAERRVRLAARRLSGPGGEVRCVRATYIPQDEICFFVFDAISERDAERTAKRAGLDPTRVVEAVSSGKEQK